MILVDTSVWIDHLRSPDVQLQKLLQNGEVVCHSVPPEVIKMAFRLTTNFHGSVTLPFVICQSK